MLRFLKKRLGKSRKSSSKPVPSEGPTHKPIGIGAECGRDSDGECRLGRISKLMKSMGLIRPWCQISTTEGVPGSQLGAGINSFSRRTPQPWTRMEKQVSSIRCSCSGMTFISRPKDENTHTGAPRYHGASNLVVALLIFVIGGNLKTGDRAFRNLRGPRVSVGVLGTR